MSRNPITSLSQLLLSLNPYEYATLAYIIGILLSEGLNYNEQASLGNFYNLLGEVIQTIGAQAQNLDSSPSQSSNVDDAIEALKGKIGNIEEIINKFKSL
ncbi:MAG: hypothetical protein K2K48_00340 [Anaeroplasmataceae bacterium]|nr:hypothetical protein [Anaeroplasmataceae bacterium]MDE6413845.1 hypothetical protein [Anaeroplasmataceae bacterium]